MSNVHKIAALFDALAQGDMRRLRREAGQLKGRVSKADRRAGARLWLGSRGDQHPILAAALRTVLDELDIDALYENEQAYIKPRATFADLQHSLIMQRLRGPAWHRV